jgi:hypothetical protein
MIHSSPCASAPRHSTRIALPVALALLCSATFAGKLIAADELTVNFDSNSRFPVFEAGHNVEVGFLLKRDDASKPDRILCEAVDYLGKSVCNSALQVPKGETKFYKVVPLKNLPAGYFEIHAKLESSGLELPRQGSMPPGIASFGIVSSLKALTPAQPDQARFGIQGTNFIKSGVFMQGDSYAPLYQTLGIRWVNMGRDWKDSEPDHAGEFLDTLKKNAETAAKNPASPNYMADNQLVPLVHMAGLPWWAIDFPADVEVDKTHFQLAMGYPPKDYQQYTDYLAELSKDYSATRKQKFPDLKSGYYQVGWEPDWHWKGTDEQFVKLYAAAYKGLHAGDPEAVVLGPGYGVMGTGVKLLERLLPLGLAQNLDGLAIHGYYLPFGNPNAAEANGKLISPEAGGAIENMRKLRGLMAQYFKPNARLIQTEWGLPYETQYIKLTPELLRLQASYVIRGQLIFLGEGCDMTYFFYTADYGRLDKGGEDGYGLCFNLTMPNPSYGATNVAPKPVFMAACTLTRVLEGTKTIGAVNTGDASVCAYLFRRNQENVLAIWTREGAPKKVKVALAGKKATSIDFMGNLKSLKKKSGVLEASVSEYPIYILGVSNTPFPIIKQSTEKK